MDYTNKTSEELIQELLKLEKELTEVRKKYENDIFQLKQVEEKAGLSEELLKKAFLTSPDAVNINRVSDGMYVSINEGFAKIMGYNAEEVIGKTSIELTIWADAELRNKMVNEILDKRIIENFEATFICKDGTEKFGLMSASIIDIDGAPHILSITKDISGLKKTEHELAREKDLMDAIMINLPDHIYFKDNESRFIRIGKALAERFGLADPSQAIGKTDFDFFTNEHAQLTYIDEQEIMRTGKMLSKEEKETHADGTDTWVSTVKMPLKDKDGIIIGTYGISRDITNRMMTEVALENERKLLRTLIDNTPDRIYAKDINNRFIICNDSLVKRMGKSDQSEIIGKSDLDFLPKELAMQFIKNEQDIMLSGEPLINHEESMGSVGGSLRWNMTTKVPLKAPDGKIIGIVGIGRDITDKKRSEIEGSVLFDIIQGVTTSNNLDDLLKLIHNSLGKVVYAENCFIALHNQKTNMFSFPYFVDKVDTAPSAVSLEKSCTALVFNSGKALLLTQEKFDTLVRQNEVELIGSDSPSWIGVPLKTPSSTVGVLVLQHYEKKDVYSENDLNFLSSVGSQIAIAIERKKAEEEIRLKNELLQTINAEKDKFFSIIAHDLRGPLSAFVAATQILTEEIQNMTPEDIRDITMTMKNDASNIYVLLENLLEWSRLQRGVMDFKPEKLKLDSIIATGVDAISGSAKTKGIDIEININGEIELTADKHMIETVIRNLVTNAVKFTSNGGRILVSASINQENCVEVRITDTGIGMTPDLKEKLFKINEKTNRPGTAGEPSSGLGLLLCKEFIEKHEGTIWVESEVGKGSTFSFKIPKLS